MKNIRILYTRISHRLKNASAQSMVEFALSLPILLLLVFGIIEFGRMMQAYLALENGARFAVRYAVTGAFNTDYCAAAGQALKAKYPGIDTQDSDHNCDLPDPVNPLPTDDTAEREAALQDWARLPSIRDAALQGATGIAWIDDPTISGDYLAYLDNASSTLSTDYRGNPSIAGYFSISTCSNRVSSSDSQFFVSQNTFYFPSTPPNQDSYRFPEYCEEGKSDGSVVKYIDDGGGPGNRVRVVLTYRHNLITPLLSTWWPSLRLTTQREGLVEQYRTSRVTGLTGGIAYASTWTFTPTMTPTPTDTPTPSDTPTNTPTFTPTNTPTFTPTSTSTPPAVFCAGSGTVLRQKFSNISGSSVSNLTSNVNYPYSPDLTDYRSQFDIETNSAFDNFGTRMRAYLCPPFTGDYTLYISSDDSSELYLSSGESPSSKQKIAFVNGYTSSKIWNKYPADQKSSPIHLVAGTKYYIEALQKEGGGGDNLAVGWTLPGFLSSPTVILGQYLVPVVPEAIVNTATATRVMTATASATSTHTFTPLPTNTPNVAQTQTRVARNLTRTAAAYQTQTAQVPLTQTEAAIETKTARVEQTQTSVAETATAHYTPPTPVPPTNTPVPPTSTPKPPTNTPAPPTNTPLPSATPTKTATCAIPLDLGGCR